MVESEVDRVRLPNGPNSRDAGDSELDEAKTGDKDLDLVDTIGEMKDADEYISLAVDCIKRALSGDKHQGMGSDLTEADRARLKAAFKALLRIDLYQDT